MRPSIAAIALTTSLFASSAAAETTEWALDTGHAYVGFTATHMVVSEVDGQFKTFSGKVLLDEKDLTMSSVEFSADVNSVDTDNADRDKHLKSPDFFDAAKNPKITFKSTSVKKAGKAYKLTGNLTMRGVTKSVTLDATISEAVMNPWGKWVRGVKITGKVNRQDFGVSWNTSLDKGGVVLGDQVAINVKLELNK